MRSRSTRRILSAAIAASTALLLGPGISTPVWAGSTVVSANPHRLTCGAANPPQLAIVQDSGVHAISYHVDDTANCEFTTALGFNSQNKPKIISDDINSFTFTTVNPRIDQVANAGEHFEHWAGVLDEKLVDGIPINGENDVDDDSIAIMRKLGSRASWLSSNGTLTRSGTELYWNGQQVTLMGFSLAPIMATKNVNLAGYLDVLAKEGVNLLRVDGISQWAALEVGAGGVDPTQGLNPFAVSVAGAPGATLTTKWNLNAFNTDYFNRAKDLVQLAAERGMVVQYSMFDRHGLRNFGANDYGRWAGSPYNPNNNTSGIALAAGSTTGQKAPPGFTGTDGTAIGGVNRAYVEKLVKEIGAYGNVIFEIMNEPLESANDWTNTADWHSWVAQITNAALATPLVRMPIPKAQTAVSGSSASFTVLTSGAISSWQWQQSVGGGAFTNLVDGATVQGSTTRTLRLLSVSGTATYRCLVTGGLNSGPATLTVVGGGQVAKDGFTAVDGTSVNGRTTESGAKVWGADNAQINGGKVRSQGTGSTRILGSVPVNTAGFATASVQAEVKQSATGNAGVGFRPTATGQFELTDGSLWVDMTRAGVVSLKKRVSGVTTTLRSVDLTPLGFAINNTVHLRLIYKVGSNRADVYVNHVKRMHDVALGFTPTVSQAGFQARRGVATDPYNLADGEIDNFEVVLAP
jgi:Cellulase (glycosyl hydrolase family 5)